jgi:alanyl-tRNA synthetase
VESALRGAARVVKAAPAELAEKIEKLVDHERQLEREIADLKRQVAMGGRAAEGSTTCSAGRGTCPAARRSR